MNSILVIALLTVLVVAGILVYQVIRYKHIFVVRKITGTKTLIVNDKAREWKDDKGVTYWKLMRMKDVVPLPPPDAISITKKGKYVVEAYRNEHGEYQYIYPSSGSDVSFFQPLTTNQRLILVEQIRKANSKRKMSWMEYTPLIASSATLIIVLVLVFSFWKDVTQPAVAASQSNANAAETNSQTVLLLQDIIQKRQMIGDYPAGNITAPE